MYQDKYQDVNQVSSIFKSVPRVKEILKKSVLEDFEPWQHSIAKRQ